MIAGHVRDHRKLRRREPAQSAVEDDVAGVLGVAAIADCRADVVKQRGIVEELALGAAHLVGARESVEQRQRQLGHMARVQVLAAELVEQRQHAAQPQIGNLVERRDLGGVGVEIVGHQSFAHSVVGDRDPRDIHAPAGYRSSTMAPGRMISARGASSPGKPWRSSRVIRDKRRIMRCRTHGREGLRYHGTQRIPAK